MIVELLSFDGCPHHRALVPRLRALLDQRGIMVDVRLRRVETAQEADRLRFLGSPTVRVDGHDVESAAADRSDFGLKCRLYRTADGLVGAPPDEWIARALDDGAREHVR